MAHRCEITGVGRQHGHRVSHANNKTKHVFKANIQKKKIFVPSLGKTITLKLSTQVLRTIDKIGIESVLKKYNVRLADLT
jgi:large subunit ribosomal protein L28